MSNFFERQFTILLEQPGDLDQPVADSPVDIEVPGEITPATMNVASDVRDNPAINFKKEQRAQQNAVIEGWLHKIEDFNVFLNGLDNVSMQSQLNSAECDTLLNNISKSETKKISRIAQDLSGLVEALKGYLLSADE